MAFIDEFRASMELVGEKRVSKTDFLKSAYVPNLEQRNVLARAGLTPPLGVQQFFDVIVAGTDETLESTYYASVRQTDRVPEPRIGRGLANWVRIGDMLLLGTDGESVFALKTEAVDLGDPVIADELEEEHGGEEEAAERLNRRVSLQGLVRRMRQVQGPPGRRERRSSVFERNAAVRDFARRRSGGQCEMPGCGFVGFPKRNGDLFIDVHHVQFLGEQGLDVIDNVAAICPNCHAKAHHWTERDSIREALLVAVREANERFRAENPNVDWDAH